jgi:hypothetical protein
MASVIYDSFLSDVFAGSCTTASTYKAMLVSSAYTEDRGAHSKRSSVTSEVTGTGYTAGGVTLALTASLNTTTHILTLTIPTATWASSTITARKLIIYKSTGTAANDNLVACIDNSVDLVSTASTMTWNASTWTLPLPAPV